MRLTLEQIAKTAGVSVSTVSRVLNRKPNVSVETKRIVIEAIQSLGETPPSELAAKGIIGFLVPETTKYMGLQTPVLLAEIAAAKEVVENEGYGLLVGTFGEDPNSVVDRMLANKEFAGAIVARASTLPQETDRLRHADIPFVFVNTLGQAHYRLSVGVDNERVGYLATRHLLELGHRRIGFLGGQSIFPSLIARLEGYRRALTKSGIPIDESLVVETDLTQQSGEEAAARLLGQRPRPTGIVGVNDYVAVGCLNAAAKLSLSVPHHLSIVGCDDIEITRYVRPALSTVYIPWRDMAALAARILVEQIRRGSVHRCEIELDVTLVPRDSTKSIQAASVTSSPTSRRNS